MQCFFRCPFSLCLFFLIIIQALNNNKFHYIVDFHQLISKFSTSNLLVIKMKKLKIMHIIYNNLFMLKNILFKIKDFFLHYIIFDIIHIEPYCHYADIILVFINN